MIFRVKRLKLPILPSYLSDIHLLSLPTAELYGQINLTVGIVINLILILGLCNSNGSGLLSILYFIIILLDIVFAFQIALLLIVSEQINIVALAGISVIEYRNKIRIRNYTLDSFGKNGMLSFAQATRSAGIYLLYELNRLMP